jgi:hypothetical protein
VSVTPRPESFLSGRVGHVGPRRRVAARAADALLDLGLRLSGAGRRLDRAAARVPRRRVLALCAYRPDSTRVAALVAELRRSRHDVRLAFAALGAARPELAGVTVVDGLAGGKFEALDAVLARIADERPGPDWTLVVDDDVLLPQRFLDRLLGACAALDLALAQPAQTLASHAAWAVARRRPGALARETRFVEIGPVTAIRRDAADALIPFPALRFGWGLDLHWAALAGERGWRLGVVDALPVRHDERSVAAGYAHAEAVAEAEGFLAERPYLPAERADRTLAVHRRLP